MAEFDFGQALGIGPPVVQIVDVGAAMLDTPDRYAGLVQRGLARVTGFEPDPEQFRRLCASGRPRYSYLPHCLGRGGPAIFHVTRFPGCSSLYEPDPAMIDLFTGIGTSPPGPGDAGGNYALLRTLPVETVRLDDVPDCPAPDYLKLDVQGSELDVLAGGERSLLSATVIECETEFVPIYKHQPLFGDVQRFLADRGFLLHKLLDVGGRAFRPLAPANRPENPLSQVLWADAIFVRDVRTIQTWSALQVLKAALILHEVYSSYDLVSLLLREHDRREGTTFASMYLKSLTTAPSLTPTFVTFQYRR